MPEPPESPSAPAEQAPNGVHAYRWILLAVVIGLAALIAFVRLLNDPPEPPPPARHRQVMLHDLQWPLRFALSPDGRLLAFVSGQEEPRVWIQPTDAGEPYPVSGSSGAEAMFWAPGGEALAVGTAQALKRVDLANGTTRLVAQTTNRVRGGDWAPSGDIVFGVSPGRLFFLAEGTGTPEALFPDAVERREPRFLPDGERLLFIEVRGAARTLKALDRKSGQVDTVADGIDAYDFDPSGHLVYTRNGELYTQRIDLATCNIVGRPFRFERKAEAGPWQPMPSISHEKTLAVVDATDALDVLAWYDRQGNLVESLDDTGNNFAIDLGPAGKRVLASRSLPGSFTRDVWLIDPATSGPTLIAEDEALIDDPQWSPRGDRFAYVVRTKPNVVYLQDVKGGTRTELWQPEESTVLLEDWSADERHLVFIQHTFTEPSRIGLLPVDGSEPRTVLTITRRVEEASLSPDGRWLAYGAQHTDQWEVYLAPMNDQARRWKLSSDGGVQPRWHADGRGLYYLTTDGTLMSVPLSFAEGSDTAVTVGEPTPLFDTGIAKPSYGADQYRVTEDGERVLLSRPKGRARSRGAQIGIEGFPVVVDLVAPWPSAFVWDNE